MTREQIKRVREWIAALRSGKYPQTDGVLSDGERFCCLGVACELAVNAGIIQRLIERGGWDGKAIVYGDGYDEKTFSLPVTVQKWLGIDDDAGPSFRWKGYGNRRVDAMLMNDDGKSFEEIADALECWLDKQEVSA